MILGKMNWVSFFEPQRRKGLHKGHKRCIIKETFFYCSLCSLFLTLCALWFAFKHRRLKGSKEHI